MSYSVYATDSGFYEGAVSDAVHDLSYRLNLVRVPVRAPDSTVLVSRILIRIPVFDTSPGVDLHERAQDLQNL